MAGNTVKSQKNSIIEQEASSVIDVALARLEQSLELFACRVIEKENLSHDDYILQLKQRIRDLESRLEELEGIHDGKSAVMTKKKKSDNTGDLFEG